jgi:hypothetical protein
MDTQERRPATQGVADGVVEIIQGACKALTDLQASDHVVRRVIEEQTAKLEEVVRILSMAKPAPAPAPTGAAALPKSGGSTLKSEEKR